MVGRPSSTGSVWKSNSRGVSDSLVDLCTGLNDVVPFKFADLPNVLLRRHGLQIVDEAGVDVRI